MHLIPNSYQSTGGYDEFNDEWTHDPLRQVELSQTILKRISSIVDPALLSQRSIVYEDGHNGRNDIVKRGKALVQRIAPK